MLGFEHVKKTEYNGIMFDSDLEARCYRAFESAGLTPRYNTESFILQPKERLQIDVFDRVGGKNKNYQNKIGKIMLPISYTPDFIIETPKVTVIIEIKGRVKEKYEIIKKLFISKLNSDNRNNILYAVCYNTKHCEEIIRIINERNQNCS